MWKEGSEDGDEGEDGERKEDQHRKEEMQELGLWPLFPSPPFANVFLGVTWVTPRRGWAGRAELSLKQL